MSAAVASVAMDAAQRQAWEEAQRLWGVSMHDPSIEPGGGTQSFAWFSFPPRVGVDPTRAAESRVAGEWQSIFAHELGHHVLSPSTRVNQFKLRQQMARALQATSVTTVGRLPELAGYLSNVWSDMLINVRVAELQRRASPTTEPGMITMWRILGEKPTTDPGWWVVLHAYEHLWGLPDGSLCPVVPPAMPSAQPDATAYTSLFAADPMVDASLVAETVRTFGDDHVRGALRFGMVLAPYLLGSDPPAEQRHPADCGGDQGGLPATAAELGEVMRDGRLREVPQHPVFRSAESNARTTSGGNATGSQGYGLAATTLLYEGTDPNVVLEAWYAAEARGWIRPYQQPALTSATGEEIPGALELWSLEDDLELIDWPSSLALSPRVIPGVTTRQRTHMADDVPLGTESVQLDLYIDSSGSMTNPASESSAILAGTILILSVLMGGGRVRVTSFSGPGQVAGNDGFTRNRADAMAMLFTFFGGGTTFPLDLLSARYLSAPAPADGARRHLVVLSDEGLQSLFGVGQPEFASVASDVRKTLDTATLLVMDSGRRIAAAAAGAGFDVEYLDSMLDAPAACARIAERLAATTLHGGPRG